MAATKGEGGAGYVRQGLQDYFGTLMTLSEASVHQHFDAFADIDWDDPDFAVDLNDERWILGDDDPLGRHAWYKALSKERKIYVGAYRWAQICKVGLEFEGLLIGGIMFHNLWLENGNPEFRYATHEATEETHHTQMFQEFVNRTGMDPAGSPVWFKRVVPVLASFATFLPEWFWVGVLAGEEPIDHMQKHLLRERENVHPMLERILAIHVAEEARHIGFAHAYLGQHVPELGPVRKAAMGVMFPVIMRMVADVIMKPSKQAQADMGIPDEVMKELWWDAPTSEEFLGDLFSDVRMLATDLGLRSGRAARFAWRLMRIDGIPARFRGEPSSASRRSRAFRAHA